MSEVGEGAGPGELPVGKCYPKASGKELRRRTPVVNT